MTNNGRNRQSLLRGFLVATLIVSVIGGTIWFQRGRAFPDIPIDFRNGQKGVLRFGTRDEKATGVLRIEPNHALSSMPEAAGFRLISHFGSVAVIDFPLPVGEFAVTGQFAAPTSYRLEGKFPAPLEQFSIVGDVPTETQPGYYGVVVAGKIASGAVLPLNGSTTANPPPSGSPASPKPPQVPGLLQGQFSQLKNAQVLGNDLYLPLDSGHLPAGRQGLWTASFVLRDSRFARQIVFSVQPQEGKKLQAGQEYSLAPGSGNSLSYSEYGIQNGAADKDWDSVSGTVRLGTIKKGTVNFFLINVRLKARSGSKAQGVFSLNAAGSSHAKDR